MVDWLTELAGSLGLTLPLWLHLAVLALHSRRPITNRILRKTIAGASGVSDVATLISRNHLSVRDHPGPEIVDRAHGLCVAVLNIIRVSIEFNYVIPLLHHLLVQSVAIGLIAPARSTA